MSGRGDHDYTAVEGGCARLDEGIFQEIKEQKVRKVAGAELGFEAVACACEGGNGHDTGVADEDVEPAALVALEELFCARANAG